MKRVWIECTYKKGLDHREKGERSVGKAIWSPVESKSGQDIYKNMRNVSAGDVIIHLVDNKLIVGTSLVINKEIKIVEGIEDTKWDGPENYLWNLGHYKEFKFPIIVKDFLNDPNNLSVLDQIRETSEVFYTRGYTLRQGAYLTPVSKELLTLLNSEFSDKHYEPRMPNITQNLIHSSYKDLDVIIEKNFDKIALQNKGKNYKSSHDESLDEIISDLKTFKFDFINDQAISLGHGDIDLVILAEDTLIIGEFKKGRNIEDEIINFNGKKNKYLKYLSDDFEHTKGKFKNVLFMVIGELIDERKLSKIEEKLCNNGLIDSDPYSYKGFNIIGNRIIHRTQIDHYFNLSKDIHIDYAKKDFYKDFNIKPIDSQKMIIPAIKMNINHDNSESYDVYNFTCKATELIKFASVARRTPVKEELSSYQRLISSKRISDIGKKFITEQKGFFPNNIVIKLEKDKISFSKSTLSDESFKGFDSEIGILEITEDYNTAWIIDGQHRLFSFFKADTNEDINDLVNVAAIVGVPPQKEVEYFIDINDKSKSVPKDLIWDLTGKIDPLSKDGIISNVCKELFSIDKTFSERQLNPFYRKLTIPSLTDKGGRNFSALCSLLKYECVGGDITREKYTKKMGDRVLTDVKNPYLGTTLETFSKNIANAFSAFFHEFGKNLHPLKTKTFYRNNNSLFILVLIADRYFRYHNRTKIVKDDKFFKILASFINDLTNEQISAYKNASNAEKRREIIGDIVYHMQMNYKENFFNIVQSQFIVDVHYFCETKFPKFVYKKIKKEFGVDFVFNCPALKSISIDYINKKNRRGTNAEAWQNLNFYSDLIKNFILNNNALKLDKDKSEEFKSMLNQNGTINVWDNCFEDIFTNKKMSLGFLSRKDFENAILRVKDYFDATRHTERKSHQVKDNYNPTVRAGIKADFEHLDKIITLELDKL